MGVYVATPTTRAFEKEHVFSLIFMFKPEGMIYDVIPNLPIQQARDVLVERFLDHELHPTHILFADSDATWSPGALMRLLERDKPVITGVIYRRDRIPVPTIGEYVGVNEDGHHVYNFGGTIDHIVAQAARFGIDENYPSVDVVLQPSTDDVQEIDGCGMHFILIKREVFEALERPWFQIVSWGAGEDFYFCRRVKEAGFPIYVDYSVHTGHILGPGVVTGLRDLLRDIRAGMLYAEKTWEVP